MSDVSLINFNLMYALMGGKIDAQVVPPLGLLSMAACLEKQGYRVDFRDYQLAAMDHLEDPFNLDYFIRWAEGCARIVGFSCMANLLPFAILCAQRLKKERPDCIVLLGGAGPAGVPREIMETFPFVDFVCVGEGETAILALMEVLSRERVPLERTVPGFYSRSPDGTVAFAPAPRIENLDQLPYPAYHHLQRDRYDSAFSVVTARGCPYSCAFCTETNLWGNRVVFRGLDHVMGEIEHALAYANKKNVVLFQDDQLMLRRERAVELFRRLRERKPKLHWKCFARVELVDEELLALMAEAGCIQVRFGVESASNRILQMIRKEFTIEQANEAIRLALKHIPSVHTSIIWGYPFETLDECEASMEWVDSAVAMGCSMLTFELSPLPNSEIYRNYKGPLDFRGDIVSNFNASGGENDDVAGTEIMDNAQEIYDLIRRYPRLFPGFYVYDYENNIGPKRKIVYRKLSRVFRKKKSIRMEEIPGYHETDL